MMEKTIKSIMCGTMVLTVQSLALVGVWIVHNNFYSNSNEQSLVKKNLKLLMCFARWHVFSPSEPY